MKFGDLASFAGFYCPERFRDREFSTVLFYTPEITIPDSSLCVCRKSDLPVDAPLVLCCEPVEGLPCADGTRDIADVYRICCDFLLYHVRLMESCNRLSNALLSGKGLSHIVDVASQVLGNPVIVADQSFKILAHGGTENVTDPFLQEITQIGFYPKSYIKKIVRHSVMISSSLDIYPPIIDEPFSPHRYMTLELMVKGKYVGFATLIEERPFKEEDGLLFSYFCRTLVTELRDTNPHAYGIMRDCDYVLMELLEGSLHGERLVARLFQSGLDFSINKRVLVIRAHENLPITRYDVFIEDFCNKLMQCPCVVFRETIVCLINDACLDSCMTSKTGSIRHLLTECDFYCGISAEVSDPLLLPKHYIQAKKAIDFGERLKDPGPFYIYEKYRFYTILEMISPSTKLIDYCSKKYLEVLQYDKNNNTAYAETLRCFLDCGLNSMLTAERMHLHRNTVIYRIKRLEDLFDIHLDDPEDLFAIQLSLRILRYLDILEG